MSKLKAKPSRYVESLHHFSCGVCGKWFAVGDAPKAKKKWFCPWCGKENEYNVNKHR